jgi:hypothetical protein
MKKDIWHYREKYNPKTKMYSIGVTESSRQVIIDIGDKEGPYLGAFNESGNYAYIVGLYEWPDSPEPKRIDARNIIRWCYFNDFVKSALTK